VSVCGETEAIALRANNGTLDDILRFPDVTGNPYC
jgi:hypothetical protein